MSEPSPSGAGAASSPTAGRSADEHRFRQLLEGLDAVVWEMDASTRRFTYVSPRAEEMLGHHLARWYEPRFWTEHLVHPEDRDRVVSAFADATAEGRDFEIDYRARTADGKVVWLHDTVRVVTEPGDSPLLRGVMVDVSDQKHAEEALQERARYAALAADVGAAVTHGGTTRQILQRCAEAMVDHLDAAFARIWLLNDADQILELQASAGMYTHLDGPHGRVPVGKFKIGLIAEERAPHLTNDVLNDPRVGNHEWARREGMVAFAGYPLLVEERLLGVVAMFARRRLSPSTLDALRAVADRIALIIDRKRTEMELRYRQEQLAEAQRIAHLGSWEWDLSRSALIWSDELFRIHGLEPQSESPTLDTYLARVHPEDRGPAREAIERVRQTGGSFDFEERIIRPDGEVRVLRSRGGAVVDEQGRPIRLMGTSQDITDQKAIGEREVQLAREQEARLQAQEAERRTAFLVRASGVLASSLDPEVTLNSLAHLAVPQLADWCAVDLVQEDGQVRRVVTAHSDPAREELARDLATRYPPEPDAPIGVPQVLRSAAPELVHDVPEELISTMARDAEHERILRELGLRSYMVVPLTARGATTGAMTFVAAESGRRYTEADLALAQELADRAAMAVDNARLYRTAEASRVRLSMVLESITDAFFALGHDWRFTYLNDEAERLLHRPRAELLEKNIWEEFPDAVGSTFEKMYRKALETQETVEFEEFFAPLDAWFEVRAYPSSEGLSVYFRNVNERHRAAEALAYQHYINRTLAENATAALFMMDERGRCTYMNAAAEAMTGYTLEEIRDISLHEAIHHTHPDGTPYPLEDCPIDRALPEDFSIRAHEDVFVRKDGTFFPVLCAASPIFRDEVPVGTVVEVRDVTADRQAEEERERLIAALDAERRRLQRIFDQAPAVIALYSGPDHVVSMTNPTWELMTGKLDAVGKPFRDVFPELAEGPLLQLLDGVYTSGEPFVGNEMEVAFDRDGDGLLEQSFWNFVWQPLTDQGGSVREIFLHAVEVTDQVRARQVVEGLEERLRLALESADIGTWDMDVEHSTLSWDERTRRIFGVPADQEIDYSAFERYLHPEDLASTNQAVQQALDPSGSGQFETEYRILRGGEVRWIRASGRALFTGAEEQRHAARFIGTVMDVTDRKEAEAERERLIRSIEASRSRLHTLFREAPAFICTLAGPNHVFESANPAYLQLVGHREVLGKPVAEALPEVVEQGFVTLLDQVYATGEPFVGNELPVTLQRTEGGAFEQRFVNFVYQPLLEVDGTTSGIFVHGVDVTDQVMARRQVEEKAEELARLARQLETSNRELDQFAYVASHDLKAPLRGIANLSSWIEEDMEGEVSGQVKEHLELLRGRVHRMEGLIDGILQYSRAGRVRERPELLDVGALLAETLDLIAPPEGVEIVVEPEMPRIMAEKLPLQQVFMNLIGNAIKYNAREGARVEVGVEDAGEFYQFRVTDNGPGIAPEFHDRIFGIFQTLEARDKVEGTGIGLSLVQKIVQNRGGRVSVESDVGAGATFRFLWPKETRADA